MSSHRLTLSALYERREHAPEAHVNPQGKSSEISRLSRFAATRPRLLSALALGAIAVTVVSAHRWLVRLLLGWDIAVWTYLILIMVMMLHVDPYRIHTVTCHEDTRASVMLAAVCLGVVASMVTIAFGLATAKSAGHAQTSHYAFTDITVLGTWPIVPMVFTVHYAHLYYRTPHEPPLRFPDEQLEPGYWNFLRFSFTIAVASQTAGISIRSRAMRQAVLGQSLLSSFFNTSILALSINTAAGLFS